MKNILKAIGAGLLLGVLLFVFSFVARVLLFVVLLGGALRLLGRGRRGFRRHGFRPGQSVGPGSYGGALPIDGQWYQPSVLGNGSGRTISIS